MRHLKTGDAVVWATYLWLLSPSLDLLGLCSFPAIPHLRFILVYDGVFTARLNVPSRKPIINPQNPGFLSDLQGLDVRMPAKSESASLNLYCLNSYYLKGQGVFCARLIAVAVRTIF